MVKSAIVFIFMFSFSFISYMFVVLGILGCGDGDEKEELVEEQSVAEEPSSKSKTIKGKDGAEMILIPGGEFLMGSLDGEGDADEHPQHKVFLGPYYIDKYEVTYAQYKKFLDATARPVPKFWNDLAFNKPNLPVVGATGNEAEAYCVWAEKRLPTEAEWEKAARGTDGRRYPWGNEFNMSIGNKAIHANILGNTDGFVTTSPVGSFLTGASPYQVMDMAGNVWEWVADWYEPNYYSLSPKDNPKGPERGVLRVLRGGAWGANDIKARSSERGANDPRSSGNNSVGFRCAQDIEKL